MDLYKTCENINTLGYFLGMRDIEALTGSALEEKYNFSQADMMILFGGSIPYGCDIVGKAAAEGISRNIMIVGGEGHTTQSLREAVHNTYSEIETKGKMEADIMNEYIKMKYGIDKILIERDSTNCGNNITNAINIMKKNSIKPRSIIIVQDSTMQRRMDAGFRKYLKDTEVNIINFASYKVNAIVKDGEIVLEPTSIWGMWSLKRYISLLMGEIPRLMDDAEGYGPNGKGYIAHVDIPDNVLKAYEYLKIIYGDLIRAANPKYSSVKTADR